MKIKLNQIKLNWILQDHKNKDPHYINTCLAVPVWGETGIDPFPPQIATVLQLVQSKSFSCSQCVQILKILFTH